MDPLLGFFGEEGTGEGTGRQVASERESEQQQRPAEEREGAWRANGSQALGGRGYGRAGVSSCVRTGGRGTGGRGTGGGGITGPLSWVYSLARSTLVRWDGIAVSCVQQKRSSAPGAADASGLSAVACRRLRG